MSAPEIAANKFSYPLATPPNIPPDIVDAATLSRPLSAAINHGHSFVKGIWIYEEGGPAFGPGWRLCCDHDCFTTIVIRDDGSVTGNASEEECLYRSPRQNNQARQ